jgi:hypothetical protein
LVSAADIDRTLKKVEEGLQEFDEVRRPPARWALAVVGGGRQLVS